MDVDLTQYRKTYVDFTVGLLPFDQKKAIAFAQTEQQILDPDLMWIHFKLCHEGANANGDCFTREVLANSFRSCVNKPIDVEHDQPMIGVMTDSNFVANENEKAYIECVGVIWKFIYPDFAQAIKEKSITGELKVSMECYYRNPNYMLGETLYDEATAIKMGLDKYVGRDYMGLKVQRVFNDTVIFGGVGVVANPADREAIILAVAKRKEQDMDEMMDKIRTAFQNMSPEMQERMKVKMAQMLDGTEVKTANTEIALNSEEKEVLIEAKEETLEKTTSSEKEEINNDEVGKIKGSEVENMDFEKVLEGLNSIEAGLQDESLKATLASIINALPEVVKKEVVEVPADEAIISKASISDELQDKVTDLETQLAEANTKLAEATDKAEKAEASLADLEAKIEAEKIEAEKTALANQRLSELQEIGIKFSEAKLAKEVDKLKAMADEDYADYKETLMEVLASAKKEEPKKEEDCEDEEDEMMKKKKEKAKAEEIQISDEEKALANLNIETKVEDENPYKKIWK